MDNNVPGFPVIGKLQTAGSSLVLPYCWFSAIDTWDNPSLCALDRYDLSADTIHFRSRTVNRPDLLPIAQAVEYAQRHDYPAVLAYCASPAVARALVRFVPLSLEPDVELRFTHTRKNAERVEFGDFPVFFDLRKFSTGWKIAAFHIE